MNFANRIARALTIGGMLGFGCCAAASIYWG